MKKAAKITSFILLLILIALAIQVYMVGYIVSSYSAKSICSCVFTADRSFESAATDLDFFPAKFGKSTIDKKRKTASSTLFGMHKRTAKYVEGLGCALIHKDDDKEEAKIAKRSFKKVPFGTLTNTLNWPYGTQEKWDLPQVNNPEKMQSAFDYAFLPEHKTRSLLVVKDGAIVKEKYIDGFDKNTPQTGWSMTKAIAVTLAGILKENGKINIDQPVDISEWSGDERNQITMRHLLAMGSGLGWEEEYFGNSDVNQMLWNTNDTYTKSVNIPLESPPGTVREYSSGTTNIISGYIRKILGNDQAYWSFPYKALLHKIGMTTAEMETDAAGNYVMSSHCYASARDWAKFGLLYLNKGNWNGEQIISEEWVKNATAPDKNDPAYGWVFVLNTRNELFADAPKDAYKAGGFNGQMVIVIPSENMVIVRLGVSDKFDSNRVVKEILEAF